ncbi:hypothetical protein IPJ91_02980 [bacterium]|nr:MAG: hypothetical protein IPJ91_02980 [bacterium]
MKIRRFIKYLLSVILLSIIFALIINFNSISYNYTDDLRRIKDEIKYKILVVQSNICKEDSINIKQTLINLSFVSCDLEQYDQKVALAEQLELTDYGKKILLTSELVFVSDGIEIHRICGNYENIALGCANTDKNTLYIYDTNDVRLEDIKKSVLAHEFLHLVYTRIDNKQRVEVDKLSESVVKSQESSTLSNALNLYTKDQLLSEYHSRVATELETLPSELERHYLKVFQNRTLIYSFYLPLKKLDETADELKIESESLNSESKVIQAQTDQVKTFANELDLAKIKLEEDRRTLDLYDISQVENFNKKVQDVNLQVSNYNSSIDQLQTRIDLYNSNYYKYNEKLGEYRSVYTLIDNSLVTRNEISNVDLEKK